MKGKDSQEDLLGLILKKSLQRHSKSSELDSNDFSVFVIYMLINIRNEFQLIHLTNIVKVQAKLLKN